MPSSDDRRLTSKQADAQDRRNRMTQRRQELTHKIRKQKKSEYLARKRNLTIASSSTISATTSTTSTTSPVGNTTTLIHSYCQNPTNETLQALHQALQSTSTSTSTSTLEENPLVFLSQEEQSKAAALLECLRTHAHASALTDQLQLTCVLQILVPLTAISSYTPSSSSNNNYYYYGHTPTSWCTLLAQNSQWLSLLVSIVPREEAACVILGNLVGEGSSQVCPALRQAGMVPALVSAIQVYPAAATWALTNAIRNDTTAWASTYCADDLLSPQLLEHLLLQSQSQSQSQQPSVVATQAAWMIASLTSREEAVVQYLVAHSSFCATLVQCLELQLLEQRPPPISISKNTAQSLSSLSVPLVQALGHIASYEDLVIPLLNSLPSLVPLVGKLLLQQPQQQQQSSKEMLLQTAWLAGCLLCDAGLVDHPSTTLAAPVLVPLLFQRLAMANTTTSISLEEKRELACALRNALSLPPAAAADPRIGVVPVPLPSIDIIGPSLSTLVDLISSIDSDAVLAALHAVDSLLRAVDNNDRRNLLITILEEANIEAALESVCDNTSALEEAAREVAANLLDDYFLLDDDEEDDFPGVGFGGPRPGMGRGRGATLPL